MAANRDGAPAAAAGVRHVDRGIGPDGWIEHRDPAEQAEPAGLRLPGGSACATAGVETQQRILTGLESR